MDLLLWASFHPTVRCSGVFPSAASFGLSGTTFVPFLIVKWREGNVGLLVFTSARSLSVFLNVKGFYILRDVGLTFYAALGSKGVLSKPVMEAGWASRPFDLLPGRACILAVSVLSGLGSIVSYT